MSDKLALLAWSISPATPALCAAPFVYASVAAALDCEVEIHFAGLAVKLLVAGVAAAVVTGADKNLYEFMQEAARQGVRFLACSMAANEHIEPGQTLIPEFSGHVGAAAFVGRTLAPDWKTLVF